MPGQILTVSSATEERYTCVFKVYVCQVNMAKPNQAFTTSVSDTQCFHVAGSLWIFVSVPDEIYSFKKYDNSGSELII